MKKFTQPAIRSIKSSYVRKNLIDISTKRQPEASVGQTIWD